MNEDVKLCMNCKHFKQGIDEETLERCDRPIFNYIYGTIPLKNKAIIERTDDGNDDSRCGYSAKYFEAK